MFFPYESVLLSFYIPGMWTEIGNFSFNSADSHLTLPSRVSPGFSGFSVKTTLSGWGHQSYLEMCPGWPSFISPGRGGERVKYPEEASSQKLSKEGIGGGQGTMVYFRVWLIGARLSAVGKAASPEKIDDLENKKENCGRGGWERRGKESGSVERWWDGILHPINHKCANQPHPKVNQGPLSTPDLFPSSPSLLSFWKEASSGYLHSPSPSSQGDRAGSSRAHRQMG